MKQVIFEKRKNVNVIQLNKVTETTPIFAMREGKLAGMLVQDNLTKDNKKWIIKTGGSFGASGLHPTRKECLKSAEKHGYTFFVEE